MKFLLDEDVPVKLLHALTRAGHDAVRVTPATPDPTIAAQARHEGRILVTLDKDFTNTALYPPSQLTIVHIRLHPPVAEELVETFLRLLAQVPADQIRGLLLVGTGGSLRILQ